MNNKKKPTPMHEVLGGKPIIPLDIKGWLIFYNLALDALLADVDSKRWSSSLSDTAETNDLESHVLVLEDRRFFQHGGFDVFCIPRIIKQIITLRRIGGVSTIEQQYVRTYLNRRERTLGRKTHEVLLAWLLSHRARKIDILRSYLNIAYFGYKLNGCDAAAKLVFNKDAALLSGEEAAFIASLLVYPLPKKVISLAMKKQLLPANGSITSLLLATHSVAPWWSKRIALRTKYSMALLSKAK